MFDNFNLATIPPGSSLSNNAPHKPELDSKLAGLCVDVVDFSTVSLLSQLVTANSRHDLITSEMEKAILSLLSRVDSIGEQISTECIGSVMEQGDLGCLQSYIRNFLEKPLMGGSYADQATLTKLSQDVLIGMSDDSASAALVYGAIAIGMRIEGLHKPLNSENMKFSQGYFEKALQTLEKFHEGHSMVRYKACLTLIWAWNETVPEPVVGLLHTLFELREKLQPDAIAVDAWDRRFTYGELDDISTRLACYLRTSGNLRSEQLIPICFEKSAWAIVAMLSILKAGAAFVPIEPTLPELRRVKLMAQLGTHAPVALVSPLHSRALESKDREIIILEPSFVDSLPPKDDLSIAIAKENAAYCLFTSGSTGEPAGVIMEHGAVVSSLTHRKELKGYTPNCRVFQFSSYSFDTCIDEIFMTLANGGCICVPSDEDKMNNLAATIDNMAVDLLEITPTVGQLIRPDEVPTVKTVVFGGEYMSQLDFARWDSKTRVVNTYGPTECCVECVVSDVTSTTVAGLIGKSTASVSWIANPDDDTQLVPIGSIGELIIEGPTLARGYLNNPDKTAQAFIKDPRWLLQGAAGRPGRSGRLYKTGDLVRYTSDGSLVYIGRKDNQIKIHGQRVELGEVESHILQAIPEAQQVIAEVLTHKDGDQALVAFIRLPEKEMIQSPVSFSSGLLKPLPEASALQSKLFQIAPRYMVPTAFFACPAFPQTISGKVDRKTLRVTVAEIKPAESTKISCANGTLRPISSSERKLQQTWADLLKIEKSKISIEDNFFHLGGDSVLAIKLAGLARKQGIKLSVADIFRHPTLAELAAKSPLKAAKSEDDFIAPFSLIGPSKDDQEFCRDGIATEYQIKKEAIRDLFPCTPLQEGFLSLNGRDTGNEYMIQKVLRLPDIVDIGRLRSAWETVVELLPILRTRAFLTPSQGLLVQGVLDDKVEWKQANNLEEYLENDKAQPMGFGDALTRYAIVENGPDKLFVWTVHHFLFDGWTMPHIIGMVERAYAQQKLQIQQLTSFSAFVKYLRNQDARKAEEFWTVYLAGASVAALPNRVTRTDPTEGRGFIEAFRPLSLKNKAHVPTTIIRAAVGVLLSQFTGADDVIFGSTVSGRQCPVPGIEDVMGPTLATVPVRLKIRASETIEDLLNRTQEQALSMIPYEHEGLHNIARYDSSCQLACNFQTFVVVQQNEFAAFESGLLGEWQGESGGPNGVTTYPIMIECYPQKDGLNIQATFDPHTFSPSEMGRMIDQFYHIVDQILQPNLARKLSDMELLSTPDLQKISTWNTAVAAPVEELLHDLALKKAKETPNALAIDAWDGRFTYLELEIASSYIAGLLIAAGVGPETMVPICFEKSLWAIVTMLAVLKAGGAFVPLDPRQPELRRQKIAKQAHGPIIVASAANAGLVEADGRRVLIVGSSLVESGQMKLDVDPGTVESPDVVPDNIAYVLFTSGSTGEPKGVVIPHKSISSSLFLRAEGQGFGPHCRVLQFTTYTFDGMLDEIFTTLIAGGCVCVPSHEEVMNNITEATRDYRVNTLGLTPTVARLINPNRVPDIDLVILWGEAVSQDDLLRWSSRSNGRALKQFITYGPTECCVTCTKYDVDIQNLPNGNTIGKSVASRSWIVNANDHHKLVPIGAVGELLIEGPAQARCYLNDQAKTEAAFIYDPEFLTKLELGHSTHAQSRLYKTGDLVRYDDDGNLMYMGRKDAQVKLNGQRVELGEIEAQLAECVSSTSHVIVDVVTLSSKQRVLAAFIKSDSMGKGDMAGADPVDSIGLQQLVNKSQLEDQLSKRVARHMIPTAWFVVRDYPRSLGGKVDRRSLREVAGVFSLQDLNQASSANTTTRPLTKQEKIIQQIWAETLSISTDMIRETDSFFQLGGNSVAAMRVAGQAQRHSISVSVADIFRHPRLCELAAVATPTSAQSSSMVPSFSLLNAEQLCQEIAATNGLDADMIEDLLPCTALQQGILSLTSRDTGDYIVQKVLRVAEDIALDKLCEAWETVVAALPILRTRFFLSKDHGIVQGILRQGVSWNHAENLDEYLRWDMEQPNGLGDVLARFAIVDNGSHRNKHLVWTMHHSLYDGWILPRIQDMVERAYKGQDLGPVAGFASFIQYITVRQNAEQSNQFWQSYLFGSYRAELLQYEKKVVSSQRGFLRTERTISLVNKQHVASTFIRAALGIVLCELSGGVNDVVFATTVFGRNCPVDGIEDVMGPTIATVPVRFRYRSRQTVESLLHSLQDQAIATIPFEHDGIQNIRKMSQSCRNACDFQAYVVIQQDDLAVRNQSNDGLLGQWQPEPDRNGLTTYPIMMECQVYGDSITVRASYSSEVVPEAEMTRIMDEFYHVLEQLVEKSTSTSDCSMHDFTSLAPKKLRQIWSCDNPGEIQHITARPQLVNGSAHGHTNESDQNCTTEPTNKITNGNISENLKHSIEPHRKEIAAGYKMSSHDIVRERKLQEIWASVLDLDPSIVGMENNFFHLGGDSVAAMKLAAAARASGWNISVSNILQFPTIAQQLEYFTADSSLQLILAVPEPYSLVSLDLKRETFKYFKDKGLQNDIIDILPTTDFQRRLVEETLSAPNTALNYMVLELGLSVDIPLLRYACNMVIENLEIFRTVFLKLQSGVCQVVLRNISVMLTEINLESEYSVELPIELWSGSQVTHAFDHPLPSFTLARDSRGDHRLIIGVSHAQYDGLSIPMILEALGCAYKHEAIPITYPFAAYLNLQANQRVGSIAYWKELLQSSQLYPTMSKLTPVPTGHDVPERVERSRTFDLPNIPERMTVALLANLVWALYLNKITGSRDIVYVTLVSGRSAPVRDIETVVGPCISLVPIRVKFSESWDVDELASTLQTQFLSLGQSETMGFNDIRDQCTDWPADSDPDSIFFHQNVETNPEHSLMGAPNRVNLHLNPEVAFNRTSITTYQEGQKFSIKVQTASHLTTTAGIMTLLDNFEEAFSTVCKSL
ncbi:peptide synthetase [Paramyrothecium foliicola]|nr:peptide synthetase [Paramyrothecium foliicola]